MGFQGLTAHTCVLQGIPVGMCIYMLFNWYINAFYKFTITIIPNVFIATSTGLSNTFVCFFSLQTNKNRQQRRRPRVLPRQPPQLQQLLPVCHQRM